MPDNEEESKFSVKTALGSATWSGKKMAELIAILSLCVMTVLAYVIWEHKHDSKVAQDQYVGAMKLISQTIENNAVSQREFACLISVPQEQRERTWETGKCRRLARIGISE